MKTSSPLFSKAVTGFNTFLENRQPREKTMIAVLFFGLFLAADYYAVIRPVLGVFSGTMPKLSSERQRLQFMEDDMRNKEAIRRRRVEATEKLKATDAQFVKSGEIPAILDSLSRLAQDCSLKIVTLQPADTTSAGPGFQRIPIRLSATAGTHELGRFLSQLETGKIYFRVSDLQITTNAQDERRHTVELSIETYAKTS